MSPDTPPPPPPPFSNAPAFHPADPRGSGPPRTSGTAVASLVLGVASLFCSCFTALPGLICGIIGLASIGKSNGLLKGRGLAILGIMLSLLMPFVGAGVFYMTVGKEYVRAGITAFKAIPKGTAVMTALQAHAAANGGRLPASLEQLTAAGTLEPSHLLSPVDGTPGFWTLTQPGAVLGDLSPETIIAVGGPILLQGEKLQIVIKADGTVSPENATDVPVIPDAGAGHGGEGPSESPPVDTPTDPQR